MNKTVLVHGPQGCGKTKNAGLLAKHFGLTTIRDSVHGTIFVSSLDTLVLTNSLDGLNHRGRIRNENIYTFEEAMKKAGLMPSKDKASTKVVQTKKLTGAEFEKMRKGIENGRKSVERALKTKDARYEAWQISMKEYEAALKVLFARERDYTLATSLKPFDAEAFETVNRVKKKSKSTCCDCDCGCETDDICCDDCAQ